MLTRRGTLEGPLGQQLDGDLGGHRAPLSNRESWGGSNRCWELVAGSGLPMETS